MKDITIIIQGKIDIPQLNRWILEYPNWNIIISTWSTQNLTDIKIPEKWSLLQFPLPENTVDIATLQWQLESTINAFQYVKTPYLVKARGDEFYSNLYRFAKEIIIKNTQIICSDIFYRGLEKNYFHISDHLMGGTSENIMALFKNTHKQVIDGWKIDDQFPQKHNPEPYLGFGFISYMEKIDKHEHKHFFNQEKSYPLVEKYFDSFPVEKLAPFHVRYGPKSFTSKYDCTSNF